MFDECHNIDNACIEAFSMNLNRKSLELASANLKKLEEMVKVEKQHNTRRLQEEYNKLVRGLFTMQNNGDMPANMVLSEKELMQHPLLE